VPDTMRAIRLTSPNSAAMLRRLRPWCSPSRDNQAAATALGPFLHGFGDGDGDGCRQQCGRAGR
jgi:hypothetical protein